MRPSAMRITSLLLAASLLLAGCTGGAVLLDPRTGQRFDCDSERRGNTPWSQDDACIADHLAQGWMIEKRD